MTDAQVIFGVLNFQINDHSGDIITPCNPKSYMTTVITKTMSILT